MMEKVWEGNEKVREGGRQMNVGVGRGKLIFIAVVSVLCCSW